MFVNGRAEGVWHVAPMLPHWIRHWRPWHTIKKLVQESYTVSCVKFWFQVNVLETLRRPYISKANISRPSPLLSPLRVGPLIQLGSLGEHCKFPQRGLGQSPSQNRIWCILALKSDIIMVATIQILCYFPSDLMNDTHFPMKGNSENFKSRTPWNPGQDPEIKDCPGKSRTDGYPRKLGLFRIELLTACKSTCTRKTMPKKTCQTYKFLVQFSWGCVK